MCRIAQLNNRPADCKWHDSQEKWNFMRQIRWCSPLLLSWARYRDCRASGPHLCQAALHPNIVQTATGGTQRARRVQWRRNEWMTVKVPRQLEGRSDQEGRRKRLSKSSHCWDSVARYQPHCLMYVTYIATISIFNKIVFIATLCLIYAELPHDDPSLQKCIMAPAITEHLKLVCFQGCLSGVIEELSNRVPWRGGHIVIYWLLLLIWLTRMVLCYEGPTPLVECYAPVWFCLFLSQLCSSNTHSGVTI